MEMISSKKWCLEPSRRKSAGKSKTPRPSFTAGRLKTLKKLFWPRRREGHCSMKNFKKKKLILKTGLKKNKKKILILKPGLKNRRKKLKSQYIFGAGNGAARKSRKDFEYCEISIVAVHLLPKQGAPVRSRYLALGNQNFLRGKSKRHQN